MSNLDSWEDDPAAQDDNLAQRTQQMNINNQQPQGSLRAGASNFQPGVPTFQPGQAYGGGQYQQAPGGFRPGAPSFQTPPQNYQQAQAYGGNYAPQNHLAYAQYGQVGPNSIYGQGGNQHGQYHVYQQQQGQQFQPQPQRHVQQQQQFSAVQPVTTESSSKPSSTPSESASKPAPPPQQKAKVLSIGIPAPPKEEKKAEKKQDAPPTAEAAAQVLATKAVKKTEAKEGGSGKTSPTSSGRSSPSRGAKEASRDAESVQKEQAADVDDETLQELYGKEHVNIIFMGHVDAGKSTLGGAILYATGQVDERTLDKYKREAKEMGRETWYLSWALDLTKEERSKGKTVEVGRAHFETEKRQYTILDAPGHKNYVPNMIGGASQADVGVLLISARKGEYETGFERGGQTREHAMLAKTQGVNKLVVVINKMDDPTVQWSQERYKECTTKLAQFLKGTGYNLQKDVTFMPVAAQTATGIKDRVPKETCPWWDGPSLLEYLDSMQAVERKLSAPFMMPNKQQVEVAAIYAETEQEVSLAQCGGQARLRLRGAEEEDVLAGFVLCSPKRLVHCVSAFEAHIRIIELPSILTAGFNCVLHVHAAIEEVTFGALLHSLQKGTGRKSKRPPTHAKKGDMIIARLEVIGGAGAVCVETYEDYPQMGRFNLRDQGITIAVGKITKLITSDSAAA